MAKLKIDRGTTYQRTGTFSIDGVPHTLIGATVRFTMKTTEFDTDTTDSDALIVKNVTTGTILGAFTIQLDPVDTAAITPGKYFYDIKVDLLSDGATVYKLDEGQITLDGSPTNRLA
jgi:hypothetical protein